MDKLYLMGMNNIVAEVYVDKDWKMCGTIIDPYGLTISTIEQMYGILKQERCEQLTMYICHLGIGRLE